jgi:glucuronokinase
MEQWAAYAEQGRAALAARDYATLGRLIDANFDLRAKLYRISDGNLQMIRTARRVGATANFAGSGGAIVGAYDNVSTYQALTEAMRSLGVAVVKPEVTP